MSFQNRAHASLSTERIVEMYLRTYENYLMAKDGLLHEELFHVYALKLKCLWKELEARKAVNA